LRSDNTRVDEPGVLTTVPMWFGLPTTDHADQTITQLADADQQTDWGMRIISSQSKLYDGSGYHYGSVWPLFTGWASVGEYRYHRAFSAYLNLRSNALLATDGALGHFTEVLSGDYYQSFATSSPHQIWSAAMVVSPILRGMFDLQTDVAKHQIGLAPHVPADWTSYSIRNVRVEAVGVDFQFRKTADSMVLEAKRTGTGECWVQFSPALSLRTQVLSVELNGRANLFQLQANSNDQHLNTRFQLAEGTNRLVIRVKNDFGLALSSELPALGSASRGLRVISESWNAAKNQLALEVSGLPGTSYEMAVWNPEQISSVEGAALKSGRLTINIPGPASDSYSRQKIVIHFGRT
jgi:hypothetical protein